jgi:hypothetical protein
MTRVLKLGSVWLAIGCGAAVGRKDETVPEAAAPVEDFAAALPASVDLVITINVDRLYRNLAVQWLGFFPQRTDDGGLRDKLGKVFTRLVGVDLAKTKGAVVFASVDPEAVGALLTGDLAGAPKGKASKDIQGTPAAELEPGLFLARIGEKVAIGNQAAIAELVRVSKGAAPKLAGSDTAKAFEAVAERVAPGGAAVLAIARLERLLPLLEEAGLPGLKLDRAGIALGREGGEAVAVLGDPESIGQLKSQLDTALGFANRWVAMTASQAETSDDLGEALGGIVAAHGTEDILSRLKIETDGGVMTVRLDLGGSVTVPMISVLAAVAVPAFIKYVRRAKTAEAIDRLDRLNQGAAAYLATPRVGADGTPLPCQFPASVTCTPPGSPCDHPDGKYPGDAKAWEHPTWRALGFQMTDPHYYRYCVSSEGSGTDATFKVTARGDLDCDGVFSTFRRTSFLRTGAGDCALNPTSAFFVDQETE